MSFIQSLNLNVWKPLVHLVQQEKHTSPLFHCVRLILTYLSSSVLQEIQNEAQWKESTHWREEALLGARVHKSTGHGLRPERFGGASHQRDRPQRMARQQQWVPNQTLKPLWVFALYFEAGSFCPSSKITFSQSGVCKSIAF